MIEDSMMSPYRAMIIFADFTLRFGGKMLKIVKIAVIWRISVMKKRKNHALFM